VHWTVLDYVIGAGLGLIGLVALADSPLSADGLLGGTGFMLLFRIALGVAIFACVGLRRRRPVLAYGALLILAVVSDDPGQASSAVAMLAAALVLYTVTVTSSRRTGAAALALGVAAAAVLDFLWPHTSSQGGGSFVSVTFSLGICWTVGYATRQRRLYADMLREQATSSAVAQERLRIARELHDVVAHSMSVIAVQAGFGQYVIDSNPSDAREALGAIQATSRDALEEMRRMLGVLRQQDAPLAPADPVAPAAPMPSAPPVAPVAPVSLAPAAPTSAPLSPEPGIDDLDRLIDRTSGTGVCVSLQRFGTPRSLPAGVGLSAYRIIQEALTNVVKHAGSGARCVVRVRFDDESLGIRVTDDGGQSPLGSIPAREGMAAMGSGHGILGMRERVHLCGGEFSAEPLPEGGFEVNATLPLHPAYTELGGRA
jgi:signal transduction histidine kinase